MQENFVWEPKKKAEKKKDWLNFVGNIFIFLAFLAVVFFLVSIFVPNFSYSLFVVKTGSMEPTIKTGSIVLSKKLANYGENDIITFSDFERGNITHRIIRVVDENGSVKFETKGDANESVDRNLVEKATILGKVIFKVPFLGYLTMKLKGFWGIAILILVPAVWIIYGEISKIKNELKKKKESSKFYF